MTQKNANPNQENTLNTFLAGGYAVSPAFQAWHKRRMKLQTDLEPSPEEIDSLPKASLWRRGIDECGLILKDDNGIIYGSQAGGVLCQHPYVRGIYVPLSPEMGRKLVAIGAKIIDISKGGLDWTEIIPLLNKHLPGWEPAYEYKQASSQAWLWVKCVRAKLDKDEQWESPFSDSFSGTNQEPLLGRIGVIVYENSD